MMLLVRLSDTFRERAPEWIMSSILLGWGVMLLLPGDLFVRPFYHQLARIAAQHSWGIVMFTIGLMRLTALYINGSRQETPVVRQIGCLFGMLMWLFLTFSAVTLDHRSPAAINYCALFVLDMIMFSYAARDAARVSASRKRGQWKQNSHSGLSQSQPLS